MAQQRPRHKRLSTLSLARSVQESDARRAIGFQLQSCQFLLSSDDTTACCLVSFLSVPSRPLMLSLWCRPKKGSVSESVPMPPYGASSFHLVLFSLPWMDKGTKRKGGPSILASLFFSRLLSTALYILFKRAELRILFLCFSASPYSLRPCLARTRNSCRLPT